MYPVSRVWEVWQVHGPVPLHSWAPLHGFAETAWPSATERHYPCLSGLVRFEEKPIINFPTQGWLDRVDSGEGCASPLLLPCDHEHWSSNWLWFCWEEWVVKGTCFKGSFCLGWANCQNWPPLLYQLLPFTVWRTSVLLFGTFLPVHQLFSRFLKSK